MVVRSAPGPERCRRQALFLHNGHTGCDRRHPLECFRVPHVLLPAQWVHGLRGRAGDVARRLWRRARRPTRRLLGRLLCGALLGDFRKNRRRAELSGAGDHGLSLADAHPLRPEQLPAPRVGKLYLPRRLQLDARLGFAADLWGDLPESARPSAGVSALDLLGGRDLLVLGGAGRGHSLRTLRVPARQRVIHDCVLRCSS
mmetsp:Transcript_105341/g.304723  ORF Transcript_105341/g.304723 Transcript_105341/m.304723 type:complete len:200 (-) Transcript_105341:397-996(-)